MFPKTLAEFENQCAKNSKNFCCTRHIGRGKYKKVMFTTLGDAVNHAKSTHNDGRTMIYAITPENWTVHICNA